MYQNFKGDIIRFFILISIIIYGMWIIHSIQTEFYNLEGEWADYVVELEDSLITLNEYTADLEKRKNKIQTITTPSEPIIQIDTIRINSTGDDVDKRFEVKFSLMDRQVGSFFKTEGITTFKWDYEQNRPVEVRTELLDSQISLNVETDISVKENILRINVTSPFDGVDISHIKNNTYNLNEIHRAKPYRWGIGIIGGYGITNKGTTPFIGVGITYTFKGLK
jgi:hypothetical protein